MRICWRLTSSLSCGIRCECHCQSQERCLRQQTKHCLYDPTLELAATTKLWAGTGYLAHLSRSLNNVALPKYPQIGAFSSWRTHDLPQTVTTSNRALLLRQPSIHPNCVCHVSYTLLSTREQVNPKEPWSLHPFVSGGEQTVDLRGNCELWKQVQVWVRLDLRLNWPHTAHNRYKTYLNILEDCRTSDTVCSGLLSVPSRVLGTCLLCCVDLWDLGASEFRSLWDLRRQETSKGFHLNTKTKPIQMPASLSAHIPHTNPSTKQKHMLYISRQATTLNPQPS